VVRGVVTSNAPRPFWGSHTEASRTQGKELATLGHLPRGHPSHRARGAGRDRAIGAAADAAFVIESPFSRTRSVVLRFLVDDVDERNFLGVRVDCGVVLGRVATWEGQAVLVA
jgi:hypothetical protein